MKGLLSRLKNAELGATAAEFAMVLPIVILFLLGTIDVGRLMWTWNKAEKATQFGARYAVDVQHAISNTGKGMAKAVLVVEHLG